MEKDMFGVSRLKVNLHMHTTLSDGSKTPEEAAEIYKKAGYDVVAITDHWIHRDSGEIGGLRILSGAEYNIGGGDASTGVYHILGIGCSKKPNLTQEAGPQKIIDEVHCCSGIAIFYYPLVADDDTHMYNCDETKAWIMLEAKITDSDEALLQAIKEEKFYATQGPEIHIRRNGDEITVLCSPVSRISFFSNAVWAPERGHRGTGLTKAVCHVQPWEKFIRAEVTDEQGRKAWSKVVRL